MTEPGGLLVGSIGISDYSSGTYVLGEREAEARMSPAAIGRLCNIDAAIILRTSEAGRKHDEVLGRAFEASNIDYDFVDIDLIESRSDIDGILNTVDEAIRTSPHGSDPITLDISHSFRSLPLVFLVSLMHLETVEPEISLERILYSRFAGDPEYDRVPVLDLTYLNTLLEWYDALATAERSGSYGAIHTRFESEVRRLFTQDVREEVRHDFSTLEDRLGAVSRKLDEGLPLETGIEANGALDALDDIDVDALVGPEGVVIEPLEGLLSGFEVDQAVEEKNEIELDKDELRRQSSIVEFYLEHDRYRIALSCARELFINRLLYDAGITTDWLDRSSRQLIAPPVGDYHDHFAHDVPEVQDLWDKISQARNTYAHAGFKRSNVSNSKDIENWVGTLCDRIADDGFWRA